MSDLDTRLDLSDMDMLDDEHSHARCTVCTGKADLTMVPYIAICGRRAINLREIPEDQIPADACPDCLRLLDQPCTRCGA